MKNQKIASFTGWRFIMIMVIVVSHFEFLKEVGRFGKFYELYIHNPTFAVDFFFLLSGFGMMLGNLNRIKNEELCFPKFRECISYGINHVRKIYPVYIVTILFGFLYRVIYAIYSNRNSFNLLPEELIKQILKLAINIPILQSATAMMTFTHAFNGVTWFLSALFCIYLISPVLIYLLRKISKTYFIDIILLLVDVIFILVLAFLFGKIETNMNDIKGMKFFDIDTLVYGSPYRRVFYVLMGMSLANVFFRFTADGKTVSVRFSNFWETVIVVFVAVYFVTRNILPDFSFEYRYLIDVLLCSFFILIFAFDKGWISNMLKNGKMQKLGNMAMYIFLIHYPIRIYFSKIVEKIFGWNLISSLIYILFILVSTFILSSMAYKKSFKSENYIS